jgi:hypothetical protein
MRTSIKSSQRGDSFRLIRRNPSSLVFLPFLASATTPLCLRGLDGFRDGRCDLLRCLGDPGLEEGPPPFGFFVGSSGDSSLVMGFSSPRWSEISDRQERRVCEITGQGAGISPAENHAARRVHTARLSVSCLADPCQGIERSQLRE